MKAHLELISQPDPEKLDWMDAEVMANPYALRTEAIVVAARIVVDNLLEWSILLM